MPDLLGGSGIFQETEIISKQKNKEAELERHSKGQFSEIRHISKEVCRIFAFVDTNAVLVSKIDKL